MSVTPDTQPVTPVREQPTHMQGLIPPPTEGDYRPSGGPGCLIWAMLGLASLVFALVIVVMAGAAGWMAGLRVAQANGTATKSADIRVQLERIPTDVAEGNLFLLERRLGFLATLTPAVPQVPQLIETATALYLTSQPTATLPPTATPTPAPLEPTDEPIILPTSAESASGYDLNALYEQARSASAVGQWTEAIRILDVILGIDSNYNPANVKGLMLDALRNQARQYYNEGKLAEAILLTNRAEDFGLSAQDELRYERYVAGLYLDAIRTVGTDFNASIRALRAVYDLGPGRYYDDVRQRLFDQYVAYGDAWSFEQQHCPAHTQYQNALNIINSASVAAKRDNANTLCQQATPTPGPDITPADGQEIAPVGVVSPTPG